MAYLDTNSPEAKRTRWIIAGLSAGVTALVAAGFLLESRWGYLPPPTRIVYVDSWAAGRTRQDALDARDREAAALDARLGEARAYVATLPPGKARTEAQAQYDRYVAAKPKDRVG